MNFITYRPLVWLIWNFVWGNTGRSQVHFLASEARWLSRGKVTLKEVGKLLQASGSLLYWHFFNKKWAVRYNKLKELKSHQVPNAIVLQLFGIYVKYDAMESLYENDTLEMFVNTSEYIEYDCAF